MKIKHRIFSFWLLFLNASYSISLTHYDQADEQFQVTQDHEAFNNVKEQLAHYYLSGQYEKEMWAACTDAIALFDSTEIPLNPLVVFDVDDTAVTHYHRIDRFEFIWGQQPHLMQNIEIGNATVNKSVLKLYHYFTQKGCTIIFMSGRHEGMRADTEKELHEAGYTHYKKLVLYPTQYPPNGSLAQWKADRRKEFSQIYNIIACVGDREYDFHGGYTGHIIKLPNYLY